MPFRPIIALIAKRLREKRTARGIAVLLSFATFVSIAFAWTYSSPSPPMYFDAVDTNGSPGSILSTKISGWPFSVDVLALGRQNTINTAYSGSASLELVDATTGNGVCASMRRLPGTNPVNVSFDNDSNGRVRINLSHPDAWPNVRIRLTETSRNGSSFWNGTVSCSSDAFAIRPAFLSFNITDNDPTTAGTSRQLNNTNVPGGVVHKAGQPFTITATGYNIQDQVTPNYDGAPTGFILPCNGSSCTNILGVVNFGGWLPGPSGTVVTSTANYTDVGSFILELQDQSFAAIDNSDGTSPALRNILSIPAAVGRFVPDHFALSSASLSNRADLACTPVSSYTYMDEPMQTVFTLTAQNAAGDTTAAYQGNLAQLDLSKAASFNIGAVDQGQAQTPLTTRLSAPDPTSAISWSTGVAQDITLQPVLSSLAANGHPRTGKPDGPYDHLAIGIAPQDADGVTLSPLNLAVANSGNDRGLVGGTSIRYGRMRLTNAIGSEALPLPVPLVTEFWNGSGFSQNTDDSCTQVALPVSNASAGQSSLTFPTNWQNHLSGFTTATMNMLPGSTTMGLFKNGNGHLILSKPGIGHSGYVDLLMAAPFYLQNNMGGTIGSPTARATFGKYKGQGSNIIYMREIY